MGRDCDLQSFNEAYDMVHQTGVIVWDLKTRLTGIIPTPKLKPNHILTLLDARP